MRNKAKEEITRSQVSVFYMPDEELLKRTDIADRAKYYREFYPYMFLEDVKNRIMPIGGQMRKKEFSVYIEPVNQKVQEMLSSALNPERYRHDIASAVCGFIADCALSLLIYETTTYEIVYLSDKKNGDIVGFDLFRINPYTLVQQKNTVAQYLPSEKMIPLKERNKIMLNPESILTFKLPKNLQGKLDKVMGVMRVIGVPSPEFFMREMAAGLKKTPYDVALHHHMKNVALAKVTKAIGWNGRNSFEKEATEYYLISRYLQFEKFKIELRENILNTLNTGINNVGKKLGFDSKIVIKGLPTLDDVKTANNHLAQGGITFKEVLEPFQGF